MSEPERGEAGARVVRGHRLPSDRMATKRVILLGSTGSIGTQTVDVVEHLARVAAAKGEPAPLKIVGLAAGRNARLLAQQAAQLGVRELALADEAEAGLLAGDGRRVRAGADAADRLVREVECDVVVAAMVGAAGLPATLRAVRLGRDVALANKETLVAAGALIVPAAQASGSRLLPVDSEHAAVWQCFQAMAAAADGQAWVPPMRAPESVSRVILTASGGALRKMSAAEAYGATPEQALAHPTWSMGAKVTLDSASLTNKAFEVIEAHWLFGLEAERIGVLIHPQSIVHALVEFADGGVIAQLGSPDMRGPIQYALEYPARGAGAARKLDLAAMRTLEFSEPSLERFPALGLAYRVIRAGGLSGAIFNAASEEATLAFLASHKPEAVGVGGTGGGGAGGGVHRPSRPVPFGRVAELAAEALDVVEGGRGGGAVAGLDEVLAADERARAFVRARLE
jgi:1-deoxy-D-xylulose-5-phosphate reductoisomerase